MNFGAFAGGLSQGFHNGVSMAKTIRDVIKEQKLQDLRERGWAEAERQRAQIVSDMIKEQGVPAPTSSGSGNQQAPDGATATAVPAPGPVETRPLPPVGLKPPAVGASADGNAGEEEARSTMPPSVSTQTPSSVQPTPAQAKAAQPEPQASPQQSVSGQGVNGNIPGQPGFWVNGQRYDTREQARAAADKAAPSAMDFFMKNAVPQIAQQYMVNGDPTTAKAWTDYAESQSGKRAIKDWAAAYSAPDFDTAATRFGKYYTDHINDGVDYAGHKMLTKDDGTQVAVVTLKDKTSGKTTEIELTREKMLALGGANNPQKLFEMEQARQREAEKMKMEARLKAQERSEKRQDDLVLKQYEHDRTDRREILKQDRLDARERIKSAAGLDEARGKAQLGIDTKIDALIGAGYGEDEIKRMMPAIVGAGDHKKTTDPTERRALIASDLVKNDPRFSSKPIEQQNKQIDDLMSVIYRDEAKGDAGKQAVKQSSGIADKPMAYDPKLPVKYRKTDGKPFHLVNGQYVPIQGTVPPQAAGMPTK